MSCYCCGWEHDPGNDFSERETLMQVIKDNAVPDSWEDDERTSLDFAKGHLVVNQTEEGHRAVKRLLAQLSQLR